MKPFVVLTATYNHPDELSRLYSSLREQTDIDFTWVVVNDGSKEDTVKAIDSFMKDESVDILPVHQKNGGKSCAINNGLDHLSKDVVFAVIVDDDEKLRPNAIATVKKCYEEYKDTNCGVIHFNRMNEKGEIIARPAIDKDFVMSYQRFKSEGRSADGYIGYFTSKLGSNRFTINEGEKYIGPSTLIMKVTESSDLLWAKAVLGDTEYLAGGITKQGRKLRIKNPKGMIEYCRLMQTNGASLKTRIAYSVQGYAYYEFLKPVERRRNDMKGLIKLSAFGKMLAKHWKKKFAEQ